MSSRKTFVAPVIGITIASAGLFTLARCASMDEPSSVGADASANKLQGRAPASSLIQNGEWGPNIKLRADRDAYAGFPKPRHRAEPAADGWWVTPIHANVLANGDVLLTGWARVQEKECGAHGGRQWPATFTLHLNPDEFVPEGTKSSQLYIKRIDEDPEMIGGEDPKVPVDVLYCSGHSPLPDGRVFFTGGARYRDLEFGGFTPETHMAFEDEYGLSYARIYDPKTKKITRVQQKFPLGPSIDEVKRIANAHPSSRDQHPRDWSAAYEKGMMWYPTNLRLPGGQVLVAGGFARQSGPFDPQFPNRGIAIFDPEQNSWIPWLAHKELPQGNHASDPTETLNLAGFDYVHLFLLPKPLKVKKQAYHVAVLGGSNGQYGLLSLDDRTPEKKRIFVPPTGQGTGPARPPGVKGQAPGTSDTTGLILPSGEIVMVGGGTDGREGGQRIDVYDPYKNRWRAPVYTGVSRIRAASVLLPDGHVLILNGEESYTPGSNIGDRRRPLLFEPATGKVTTLDPWTNDDQDRGYHNFAVLLKDGRVLLGGGRELIKSEESGREVYRIGCERTDLRVYSPPYLFKGPRPEFKLNQPVNLRINGAAIDVSYSGPELKPADKGGVVLMALPSETHHFDQNQRMAILHYAKTPTGIRISPPSSAWAAPEGNYTLHLVSAEGVPSLGVSVHLE